MSTGSLDGQVDSGFHPNRCCNTTDKTIENRVLSISAGKENISIIWSIVEPPMIEWRKS